MSNPSDVVLIAHRIPTKYLLQNSRSNKCPITILSFNHTNHLRRQTSFIFQFPYLPCRQKTVRSIRRSLSKFSLNKLVFGQRIAELFSLERVSPREIQCTFQRADDTPRNSIPCIIKTGKWTLQALYMR